MRRISDSSLEGTKFYRSVLRRLDQSWIWKEREKIDLEYEKEGKGAELLAIMEHFNCGPSRMLKNFPKDIDLERAAKSKLAHIKRRI